MWPVRPARRGHRRCFSRTVVALAASGIIGPRRRGCVRLASWASCARLPRAVSGLPSATGLARCVRPDGVARPPALLQSHRGRVGGGRRHRAPRFACRGFVRPLSWLSRSLVGHQAARPDGVAALLWPHSGRPGGCRPRRAALLRMHAWQLAGGRETARGRRADEACDASRLGRDVAAPDGVARPPAAGLSRRGSAGPGGWPVGGGRPGGGANCRYIRSTEAVAGGPERLPEAEPGLIGVSRPCQPAERHRSAAKRVSRDASRRRFVLTGPFAPRKKRQAVVRFGVKQPPRLGTLRVQDSS
jgi:hypothetical protein